MSLLCLARADAVSRLNRLCRPVPGLEFSGSAASSCWAPVPASADDPSIARFCTLQLTDMEVDNSPGL